jgi:hypothetical protein
MRYIFFFLIFFTVATAAQEPPKALMVDEFGVLGCESWLVRLDFYFNELRADPASTGWIIISGPSDKKQTVLFRQSFIEQHAKWRGFDISRVHFARAISNQEFAYQLWRIPPGATAPEIPGGEMSLSIDSNLKPFMMGERLKFGDPICPNPDEGEVFAKFLVANPSARGNLVVKGTSLERARAEARKTLRTFSAKHGVARARLRAFAAKLTKGRDEDEAIIEFWYLP